MKKIIGICLSFLSFCTLPFVYAGGGLTHMYIAHETIKLLPDAKLRNLLLDNLDAYLVGAYYPDSGYIQGTGYGEDSHWDAFIYAFADYIKEKYPHPIEQNPKLVAFLFGCATHRESDEIIHWTFYNVTKDKDFNGDWNQAHAYGDPGIDFLLNIDKNQWLTEPTTWWIPLNDLLAVYHRMGKDQYTAKEIIWGNSVIYFVTIGERLISPLAYPFLEWKMPWTASHYYDWANGGILMDEQKVEAYLMDLWMRLNNSSTQLPAPASKTHLVLENDTNPMNELAQNAITSGMVTVDAKTNADGSVEIQPPVISQFDQFKALMSQFISRLMGLSS